MARNMMSLSIQQMLQRSGLMFPPCQNAFPVCLIFLALIAIVPLFVVCSACHSHCSKHLLQQQTSENCLCSAECFLLSWMEGRAAVILDMHGFPWSHVFIMSFSTQSKLCQITVFWGGISEISVGKLKNNHRST